MGSKNKPGITKLDPRASIKNWQLFQAKDQRQKQRQKPQQVTKKLPNLSHKRRWRLIWRLALVLGLFGSLLLGLSYYLSSLSKLDELTVRGMEITPAQDIIDASQLDRDSYVLAALMQRGDRAALIKKQIPALQSVGITFQHWNRGVITVKERQTVGFMVQNDHYRRIFANGQVDTAQLSKPIGNFPVYSQFKVGSKLRQVVAHYAQMPTQIQHTISEIKSDPSKANPYRLHLYMNDGNEVIADARTMVKQMQYYGNIVSHTKKKGIVDLEVGAFFTPFTK